MPLEIYKKAREEDLVLLELFHRNGERASEDEKNDDGVERLAFFLRPLTSGELNELSDKFISTNRKGSSSYKVGDNARSKFLKAVVRFEGEVHFEGQPIDVISREVYGFLRGWISEAVLEKINEMNGLSEDEESE